MLTIIVRVGLLVACTFHLISAQGVIWGEERNSCEYETMMGYRAHAKTKIAKEQGNLVVAKAGKGRMVLTKGSVPVGNMTEDFYLNHAPSSALFNQQVWDRVKDCYDANGNEIPNSRFTKMCDFVDAVTRLNNLPPYEIATADPFMTWFKRYTVQWCCVSLYHQCENHQGGGKCDQIIFELFIDMHMCTEHRPAYCPPTPNDIALG